MKKSTSFHLEEDILKYITDYQEEHNLSSRNIALERMILEIKTMKKELEDKTLLAEYAKSILLNSDIKIKDNKNDLEVKGSKTKNEKVRRSILNAYQTMSDGE